MTRQFKLPDLGEGVHEGQVIRLLVREGDQVLEDQPLMEVETDKAAVEIPSPYTGVVQTLHVAEQQIVNVGDVMVTFGGADARESADVKTSSGNDRVGGTVPAPRAADGGSGQKNNGGSVTTAVQVVGGHHKPASPVVRKRARALGLDLNTITGSGPNGRVTMRDVEEAAKGSGSGVKSAPVVVRATPQAAGRPMSPSVLPDGVDDSDAHGSIRRVSISMARRTIAHNMLQSITTIPHVTDNDDADITELDALRRGFVYEDNPNRKLRVLPFAVRAVARALLRYPIFCTTFDAEAGEIVYRKYINIAIGVQTSRGLVAPVLRDVDRMSVLEIADALDGLAEQARGSGFSVADTRGGTFTISNAGAMGGSRYSSPIISPGQAAVLALGRGRMQAWVRGNEIVPRLIQPLSLSFDHRGIDGAEEIAFMKHIIADLENPARVML